MVAVSPHKAKSEQLRREVEKLRAAVVELKYHAATLVAKSAELEKQILRLHHDNPKQSKKS
jgi:hypothetical protein